MQMAGAAKVGFIEIDLRQMTGGRTLAIVLNRRIGAIDGFRLELNCCAELHVGGDVTDIDALLRYALANETTEGVVTDAADPADFQTKARQTDSDVGFCAGQATRIFFYIGK